MLETAAFSVCVRKFLLFPDGVSTFTVRDSGTFLPKREQLSVRTPGTFLMKREQLSVRTPGTFLMKREQLSVRTPGTFLPKRVQLSVRDSGVFLTKRIRISSGNFWSFWESAYSCFWDCLPVILGDRFLGRADAIINIFHRDAAVLERQPGGE